MQLIQIRPLLSTHVVFVLRGRGVGSNCVGFNVLVLGLLVVRTMYIHRCLWYERRDNCDGRCLQDDEQCDGAIEPLYA